MLANFAIPKVVRAQTGHKDFQMCVSRNVDCLLLCFARHMISVLTVVGCDFARTRLRDNLARNRYNYLSDKMNRNKLSIAEKPLDQLTETDLQGLVLNQVAERKRIEYKLSLPGGLDSEKKEFLADASSFANASGGYLLYGVKESLGIPEEICGVSVPNSDEVRRRLESMIRDGIEPRISGVDSCAVPLKNGNVVIVICVPMSWAAPHMITYQIKNHWRFYGRSSNGKYPLDVHELGSVFLLSETTIERIRNFRAERLEKIDAGENVPFTAAGAKVVLHLVPLQTFRQRVAYDVKSVRSKGLVTALAPPSTEAIFTDRMNFDGLRSSMEGRRYVQIFRNGCVEAVEAGLLREGKDKVVPSGRLAGMLGRALTKFTKAQRDLKVQPPVFAMLSLLQVREYRIGNGSLSEHAFDRDRLIVPEVILEDLDTSKDDLEKLLKDMLAPIANAAGLDEWPA